MNMKSIFDFLDLINEPENIKQELYNDFNEAACSSEQIVKENMKNIVEWTMKLSENKMTKEEFEYLVRAQKRKIEQYLNTLEIEARVKIQKITINLLDIVLERILPKI